MQPWQLSSISDETKAERRRIAILSLLAVAALVLAVACHSAMTDSDERIAMQRVILQGEGTSALAELVADAGGHVTPELDIVSATILWSDGLVESASVNVWVNQE